MSGLAIVSVTEAGTRLALKIQAETAAELFIPEKLADMAPTAATYESLSGWFAGHFNRHSGIICVMAQGIVTRMIAPFIQSKHTDPAIVTCDEMGRFSISTLSGHEGGANPLAYHVSSITGAEPVITTATEANKCYTAGIGARKGVTAEDVTAAVTEACAMAGIAPDNLRSLTSAWAKKGEAGIHEAAKTLGVYLRFIPKEYLENPIYRFEPSAAERNIGVPAVAEPCALLSARNPELILPKTIIHGVTVAIARERIIGADHA